jgi:flagellar protein FlbD
MIKVTRLNNSQFYINPLLIETIEEVPDTMISLVNGKKYVVKEPAKDVILGMKRYLSEIHLLQIIGSVPNGEENVQE